MFVWGRHMQIPKPTEQDKDFLRSIVPNDPRVELKPMFGNLGAFVNGNMFAGLFGSTVGVRLIDDASREELAAIQGTGPFGPAERPMGGYLALPQNWSTQPKLAAGWASTAMTQVAALPPKAAKRAKPKAKSTKSQR
jgi:TfoX/Sxy family transcriptional regulator of competence genes